MYNNSEHPSFSWFVTFLGIFTLRKRECTNSIQLVSSCVRESREWCRAFWQESWFNCQSVQSALLPLMHLLAKLNCTVQTQKEAAHFPGNPPFTSAMLCHHTLHSYWLHVGFCLFCFWGQKVMTKYILWKHRWGSSAVLPGLKLAEHTHHLFL